MTKKDKRVEKAVGLVEEIERWKTLATTTIEISKNGTDPVVIELSQSREWLYDDLLTLARTLAAKSNDYAAPLDDMENFRGGGLKGIVNRMMDKFQRLKNFIKYGKLQNESFDDSCLDIAGYALLLKRARNAGLSVEGEVWQ